MKKKVLFVDDEPNVLGGLRRMLRPLQKEWTTEFADGGPQALAVLEREPFDIIVSDMRMPGMTGAQLLEEVGQRFPSMVRIILTGQCDEESGLRALRVAHQMLYKPCDADSLKATVARTCSWSDLLANEALQAIVTRQASIPSVPALYRKVREEMQADAPSLDRVAALVSKDIGMVAKILHVVNSSFFGLRREITDAKQAVMLLGVETMRVLVLTVGIFSPSKTTDHPRLSMHSLHAHSHATSALAEAIANTEASNPRESAYAAIAGLLHDVGKLVLIDCHPQKYPRILNEALTSAQPLWTLEQEAFGASHAEIGACVLGLWGLPMPIVEAIAWHHRPSDCPVQAFGPLTVVHVANALTSRGVAGAGEIDHAYLERLNLVDRLPAWIAIAQALAAEAGQT
jgi:HD-like signal output (HDOD) protein